MSSLNSYETDFYPWTSTQADLLRHRKGHQEEIFDDRFFPGETSELVE